MPTAFRVSWDRVCCGKILKYDGDECSQCGDVRDDLYGCEYCGDSFCEEHLMSDEGVDVSGYRGEIDSGHPIENHEGFTGGAYCGECASNMINDGSLDDEGNPIPDEEYEGLEVALPQMSPRPINPLANASAEDLMAMTDPVDGNERTIQMAVREIQRRMEEGSVEERTKLGAMTENQLNTMGQKLGRNPMIAVPPSMQDREFGFPGDFTDKFASADAFTSAWDVVKRERI